MTRQQQAYRTSRARQQFRELQRTEPYKLGHYRRRRDWSSYLFWGIVGVVVLVALLGVGIFIAAVWRLVMTGLGL